jgi:hypothetical protein
MAMPAVGALARSRQQEREAFMEDLQQALDKFGVPQSEQGELKAIVVAPL